MNKVIKLENGKELTIRSAISTDANMIIDYLNEVGDDSENLLFCGDDHVTSDDQKRIIETYNNNKDWVLCLAIINDDIVSISKLNSSQREKISHISNLAISVKKNYCDLGICKAVIEEILKYAKAETSIKTINLMVNEKNKEAITTYKELGFEEVGVFKDYYYLDGKYINSIIMNNYLNR